MDKETSAHVSSLAAKYLRFETIQLTEICQDLNGMDPRTLCEDIRTLAASCLSQDETPGQDEPTLLGRLKIEHAHLSRKLDRLTKFIGAGAPEVSPMQLQLLSVQHSAMTVYLRVLQMRLTDLDRPKTLQEIADENAREETFDHKTTAVASELDEPVEVGGHSEDSDGPVKFGD
jgi:hypothetical protein